MGLLTGGLSFRRYRVYGDLPSDFRETYLDSVLSLTHQENLKHRSKEPLIGWVSITDPADVALDLNTLLYDHYLVLSLRQDKKAINSKLFSILLDRRQKEVKEERGLERLGKNHKDEIKEALEEELLSLVWRTGHQDEADRRRGREHGPEYTPQAPPRPRALIFTRAKTRALAAATQRSILGCRCSDGPSSEASERSPSPPVVAPASPRAHRSRAPIRRSG